MRVVSLVPSVTETLLAWGIEPVACTRFCEQPSLRHVGGTKDPDIDAIVALRPDLVVMDREENRRDDADSLEAYGVPLHITHVVSLDDVAPMLQSLCSAVGDPVETTWSGHIGGAGTPARAAFVPIWRRPWMTLNADTYGSSVLRACGIDSAYADHPDRYPTVTLDDAASRAPDLVILPSEPYPFTARHVHEASAVSRDVRLVDGRDLFWWGARTPGALARLGAVLAG